MLAVRPSSLPEGHSVICASAQAAAPFSAKKHWGLLRGQRRGMSLVFLGLGSNQGDRKKNLEDALREIKEWTTDPLKISPIYETSALRPSGAPLEWDQPFLNLAVQMRCSKEPHQLLAQIHQLEKKMGRQRMQNWSPRILDIDILLFDQQRIDDKSLKIPHPEIQNRAFVLDPLKDLAPSLKLDNESVLSWARRHPRHSPALMAIFNITPDSFSDGGELLHPEKLMHSLEEASLVAGYIDVGAESTRPGATGLSIEEEWQRLEPVLKAVQEKFRSQTLKPQLSVDTRHGEVALRALEYGADMINDVGGLACPQMKEILQKSSCDYVLMHSLTVPADPRRTLSQETDPVRSLFNWFEIKLKELQQLGVEDDRIWIDPGIGFGKTPLQSFEILRRVKEFWPLNRRLLIGHSRKSFLGQIAAAPAPQRDFESIGVSLALEESGVDILRVHNPRAHHRARRAYHQLRS